VREALRGCPGVAPLLDRGRHDGCEFFCTRWIEAEPAAAAGSLGALEEAVAVARVLAAVHGRGFAHGDLEPDHVLVAGDGVWLLDFGSAVPLAEAKAHDARPRDLFSMGCYLAERLLGASRFAYQTPQAEQQARRLEEELPSRPDTRIVRRALAAGTGAQTAYESVEELERELQVELLRRRREGGQALGGELGSERLQHSVQLLQPRGM
jgi:serine/threonine protein kinase